MDDFMASGWMSQIEPFFLAGGGRLRKPEGSILTERLEMERRGRVRRDARAG